MCFRSDEFIEFCDKYGVTRSVSSPYHPQGNGQAESSNKSLLKIIKRTLDDNKKAWDSKLQFAIWADRVTVKKAIGVATFDLVNGIQDRIPQNSMTGLYNYIQIYDDEIIDDMHQRIDELAGLVETRKEASVRSMKLQLQTKNLYDRRTVIKKFQPEDLVLMWNARLQDKGKHGKFDPIWLGPYLIDSLWGNDSYFIKDLSGNQLELPVHGQFMKRYFC